MEKSCVMLAKFKHQGKRLYFDYGYYAYQVMRNRIRRSPSVRVYSAVYKSQTQRLSEISNDLPTR